MNNVKEEWTGKEKHVENNKGLVGLVHSEKM